eukprot:COSAG02_NODE_49675_length_325_cov_0.898230_1_plen_103_part_10
MIHLRVRNKTHVEFFAILIYKWSLNLDSDSDTDSDSDSDPRAGGQRRTPYFAGAKLGKLPNLPNFAPQSRVAQSDTVTGRLTDHRSVGSGAHGGMVAMAQHQV